MNLLIHYKSYFEVSLQETCFVFSTDVELWLLMSAFPLFFHPALNKMLFITWNIICKPQEYVTCDWSFGRLWETEVSRNFAMFKNQSHVLRKDFYFQMCGCLNLLHFQVRFLCQITHCTLTIIKKQRLCVYKNIAGATVIIFLEFILFMCSNRHFYSKLSIAPVTYRSRKWHVQAEGWHNATNQTGKVQEFGARPKYKVKEVALIIIVVICLMCDLAVIRCWP